MTHEQSCGPNTLVAISSQRRYGNEDDVVRWCAKCGAVVIDIESDNRLVQAGGRMRMAFPANRKQTVDSDGIVVLTY